MRWRTPYSNLLHEYSKNIKFSAECKRDKRSCEHHAPCGTPVALRSVLKVPFIQLCYTTLKVNTTRGESGNMTNYVICFSPMIYHTWKWAVHVSAQKGVYFHMEGHI
jgi:hypothetical protein